MARVSPALIASLPNVWQGRRLHRDIPVLATGHPVLDRGFSFGGWPLGALTEMLTESPGAGEVSLLLPALAHLTQKSRWVVLVDPPWLPYPPAMRGHGLDLERVLVVRTGSARQSLWACEQALRGVRGGVVMAWPEAPSFARLRRLQLAARSGRNAAFLFRSTEAAGLASPAALRLQLAPDEHGTRVTVLKCRGRRPDASLLVRRSHGLPGATAFSVPGKPCPAAGWAAIKPPFVNQREA